MLPFLSGCTSCRKISGHPEGNIFFNHHESSIKDFALFLVISASVPFLLPPSSSLLFSRLTLQSVTLSPSSMHSFSFILPPVRIDLLCRGLGVWRAASFSELRWISCHGNQTQITNNGMLITVITVRRLLQENERRYFSLWGLKKRKCQRWGSLDNIIHNRAAAAEVLGSAKGCEPPRLLCC